MLFKYLVRPAKHKVFTSSHWISSPFLKIRQLSTGYDNSMLSRSAGRKFKMNLARKPKVELHVHLDGSVRPETIWDISRERGIEMPVSNREEMKSFLKISVPEAKTLTEFLDKFFLFLPVLVGDAAAIRRISYEFCEDLAREHVIYAETRLSPHLLASDQLSPRQVVEIVLETLKSGRKDFGVRVNLILACMRHEPSWSAEVLELCKDFRSRGVVGIDLAGDENLTKLRQTEWEHIKVFQEAERLGIRRTVHAGENGPSENVRIAVDEMKAERIGHGYHALQDPHLYQSLLDRLAFDGANFSINSDDPTLTGCFLHGEYQFAQDKLELSDKHLIMSNLNAAKSAFLPEDEKQDLIDRLKLEYEKEIEACQIDLSPWKKNFINI